MTPETRDRLEQVSERFEEVTRLLADPEVLADSKRFQALSREYGDLEPVVRSFEEWLAAEQAAGEARAMLDESDAELRAMATEEIERARSGQQALEQRLRKLLLPKDPKDERNIFLEIRAGTGGQEAALFAGDLFRMYTRYAENQGWQVEIIHASEGEHGGYKEIIARIIGKGAFSRLKFESGTHRVQRVPATESQGRIHTSACTVAILPEAEEIDEIRIDPTELRIDTFRSSGAGGQHVNTTDSAIRITHLPTGLVVECQDERSQHKNRARAMSLLQSRLMSAEHSRQQAEQAASRKLQVGSGDRSERIRTYNFPQGRITDHRIDLTLYQLEQVIAGNLEPVINPLIEHHQAELLGELT